MPLEKRREVTPRGEFRNSPFQTAKERIEAWPNIRTLEMAWLRDMPGELRPAIFGEDFRGPEEVIWPKLPTMWDRSGIHTHPWPEKLRRPDGMTNFHRASDGDIIRWFGEVSYTVSSTNCWHIIALGKAGNVIGFVTYMATPEFKRLAMEEDHFYMVDLCTHIGNDDAFRQHIYESGLLRERPTAMPGYFFDKAVGHFKQIEKK
jgi:hypothetical protein